VRPPLFLCVRGEDDKTHAKEGKKDVQPAQMIVALKYFSKMLPFAMKIL